MAMNYLKDFYRLIKHIEIEAHFTGWEKATYTTQITC